jgi:hypothetical protein
MVNYITELTKASTQKLTENGAVTFATSDSKVLDFFAQAGAMRGRSEDEIIELFKAAFEEDRTYTLKVLFYIRDIRNGQGERRVFRVCLKYLTTIENTVFNVSTLYTAIVQFGRYDDLYEFVGTSLEKGIFELLNEDFKTQLQLIKTGNFEKMSLLGKWLKSENATSKETKRLALITRKYFKLTSKQYRKSLTLMRRFLNVVETKMCANTWDNIQYSAVPSQAMLKYKDAFKRHDETGFSQYLDSVNSGETKINTQTLAPYQLVNKYKREASVDTALETLWTNLPNFAKYQDGNAIVVADVSGSMDSPLSENGNAQAIDVSIALAIYFAQRNTGVFKNNAISFTSIARFIPLHGTTLLSNIRAMLKDRPVENTNLQSVFELILNVAMNNKVKEKDMIKTIYLVSDMEFDQATDASQTLFEAIKKQYADAGYKMPKLIFWNVMSRQSNVPVKMNENGVVLVSGCSASTFSMVVGNTTPYRFMLDVINHERYNIVSDIIVRDNSNLKNGKRKRQRV